MTLPLFGGGFAPFAAPGRLDHPGYVSGRFYGPMCSGVSSVTAVAANTLYVQPLPVQFPVAVNSLGYRIGTAVAGVKGKFALYNAAGALLAENTTDQDMGAVAGSYSAAFSGAIQLPPGMYWAAFCSDGAAQLTTWSSANTQGSGFAWFTGGASLGGLLFGSSSVDRLTAPLTYVAATPFFPATLPTLTLGTGSPGSPYLAFGVA